MTLGGFVIEWISEEIISLLPLPWPDFSLWVPRTLGCKPVTSRIFTGHLHRKEPIFPQDLHYSRDWYVPPQDILLNVASPHNLIQRNQVFSSVFFSLPHSWIADDLLNRCTFLKGRLCIFSFWNLRMLPTDWWIGAHDNRSAVAAVSFCPAFLRREELGRLWQLGKRFNFKVTGKQRKNHKIKQHTRFYFPALFAWPALLDWHLLQPVGRWKWCWGRCWSLNRSLIRIISIGHHCRNNQFTNYSKLELIPGHCFSWKTIWSTSPYGQEFKVPSTFLSIFLMKKHRKA